MKKSLYMTIVVLAACLGMSSCDDMPHYTDLPQIDYNPECSVEPGEMQDSTVSVFLHVTSDYPVEYISYSLTSNLSSPVRADYEGGDGMHFHYILTGLRPATTYYYVVYADYEGYTLTSDVLSFTTPEYSLPARQLSIAELHMLWWDDSEVIGDILKSSIYAAFKTQSGNYMQFGNTIFDGITGTEGSPWAYTLNTPVTVNDGDHGDVIFGAAWKGFDKDGNIGTTIDVHNQYSWPYRGLSEYSYSYPAMSVKLHCPLALVKINFTVEEEMTISNVQLWNSDNRSIYGAAEYNVLDDSFVLSESGMDLIGEPLFSYSSVKLSPNSTTTVQFVVIPQKLTDAPRLYYSVASGAKFIPLPTTPGEWGKYSTIVYDCKIAADRTTISVGTTTINGWTEQEPVDYTVK